MQKAERKKPAAYDLKIPADYEHHIQAKKKY
jgi:hypothetical protein